MSPITVHDNRTLETAELAVEYLLGNARPLVASEYERHLRIPCSVCNSEVARISSLLAGAFQSPIKEADDMRARFVARLRNESNDHSPVGKFLFRPGVLVSRSDWMAWENVSESIERKLLYIDEGCGYATALVRMKPGTSYPAHRHVEVEEVFLLSGDLTIENATLRSGDYCRAEKGTVHGAASTQEGCLFVLIAFQGDEILP